MNFVPVTLPPSPDLIRTVRDLVGDARMVVLGEEMHGDGRTFVAKARLARIVFEQCGFDTMGWESPIYDVRAMNELGPEVSGGDFGARGLFAIWHGEEIEPFLEYCRSRGIVHAGVDCQLLNETTRAGLSTEIESWSTECSMTLSRDLIERFLAGEDDSPEPELERLHGLLRTRTGGWPSVALWNVLANRRQERLGAPVYGPYLQAGLAGEVVELDPFDPTLIACNSARDYAMGANAMRLLESGRRVVLWAANYHAIRALSATEPYAGRAPDVRTMGDYLHEHAGSDVKVVLATSLRGSRWDFDQWEEVPIDERTSDSSEHDWPVGAEPQFAVVRLVDELPGPVHLVGVGPMRVDHPARHFDAILHVELQVPPTYTRW